MARPRKRINPEVVRKLAAIHCAVTEIAAFCDCSTDTINRRFAAELQKGREQGKITLRKGLWDLAQKGNLGALIWLSKNHLGMSDKLDQSVSGPDGGPQVILTLPVNGSEKSDDS